MRANSSKNDKMRPKQEDRIFSMSSVFNEKLMANELVEKHDNISIKVHIITH